MIIYYYFITEQTLYCLIKSTVFFFFFQIHMNMLNNILILIFSRLFLSEIFSRPETVSKCDEVLNIACKVSKHDSNC
jgi:hypothetical protein